MEGLSTVTYKNKQIIYLDYSIFGDDKEKAKELIKIGTQEYMKYPLKSVLALVNVTNLRFDSEMMNLFKVEQDKSAPYEKKVAVIGMIGLKGLLTILLPTPKMLSLELLIRINKPKTGW